MLNPVTPTISDFLNATTDIITGGSTPGLTPFMVNGHQLATPAADVLLGLSAAVWQTANHQLIVAYRGSDFSLNNAFSWGSVLQDLGVALNRVTPGEVASADFARTVVADAAAVGISSNNVFLTGISLGGDEAAYAASKTGLAGVAFDDTGLPAAAKGVGDGTNFVNIITYGDPVSNFASDISALKPFIPGGYMPHYGQVIEVGKVSDQNSLSLASSLIQSIVFAPFGLGILLNNFTNLHDPRVIAHDLGVHLTAPPTNVVPGLELDAPITYVADDTILQLLKYFRRIV